MELPNFFVYILHFYLVCILQLQINEHIKMSQQQSKIYSIKERFSP